MKKELNPFYFRERGSGNLNCYSKGDAWSGHADHHLLWHAKYGRWVLVGHNIKPRYMVGTRETICEQLITRWCEEKMIVPSAMDGHPHVHYNHIREGVRA